MKKLLDPWNTHSKTLNNTVICYNASLVVPDGVVVTGLKTNFFVQEPPGDYQKKLGSQIVNFGL